MKLLSTTLTLAFKIFFPTFWIAFFGTLLLAIFAIGERLSPLFVENGFRLAAVLFYLIGIVAWYYLFMRLKRVEVDDQFLYVTNYFKTARYPYTEIKKIEEQDVLLLKKIRIYLKKPGIFGTKIVFITTTKRWNSFVQERSDLLAHLN